jgi:hypothetical protein
MGLGHRRRGGGDDRAEHPLLTILGGGGVDGEALVVPPESKQHPERRRALGELEDLDVLDHLPYRPLFQRCGGRMVGVGHHLPGLGIDQMNEDLPARGQGSGRLKTVGQPEDIP